MVASSAQRILSSASVPAGDSPFERILSSASVPVGDSPFAESDTGKGGPIPIDELPPQSKSKAETELILKSMLGGYVGIGKVVALVNRDDGIAIARNAEDLCESWRMLLDNDPKLRKTMLRTIKGSGWGAVISAHAGVALAILGNHPTAVQHLYERRPKFMRRDDGTVSAD